MMSCLWICVINFCWVLFFWFVLILVDDSGLKVWKLISKNCVVFDVVCDVFDLLWYGEFWNWDIGVGCCFRNGSFVIFGC